MTDALKGIERARALAQLLQAKAQSLAAQGLEKAKLVKAILDLRRQLGMMVSEVSTVVSRIMDRPLDLGNTLTSKSYSEQMRYWLPDLDISVDSMDAENAKGTAAAIEKVAVEYPEVFRKHNVINIIGTGKDLKKMRNLQEKRVEEALDSYAEKNGLIQEKEAEYEEVYGKFFQGLVVESGSVSRYSARNIAKFLFISEEKEVKSLLRQNVISLDELKQIYKKVKVRRMARGEAAKVLKEENPDLFLTHIPNFRGMQQQRGTYAMYVRDIGVIATTMFEKNIGDAYNRDVGSNWHPKGTGGEAPHQAATSVMLHELGHAMDRLLGLRENDIIFGIWSQNDKQVIEEGISRYAATNIAEMIAEAFCEYKMSASPRALAMQIGTVIDQEYNRKYGQQQ